MLRGKDVGVPKGRRIALVSNSGGVAALFADMLSDAGLQVGALSRETRGQLAAYLPGQEASGFNPADVNVLPYGEPSRYLDVVRSVAKDDEIDAVLLFLGMQRSNVETIASGIGTIQAQTGTPIVTCIMGCHPELSLQLRKAGVLVTSETEAAVKTLALLTAPTTTASVVARPPPARSEPAGDLALWVSPWNSPHNDIFARFDIDILPTYFETETEAAVARAEQIGFPVAIKLYSKEHTHKSDIGGVRLDVGTAEEVRAICGHFRTVLGGAGGFLIQRMCPFKPIAEVFVGCKRDAVFGDVILLGSGGVFVNEWADAQIVGNPDDPAEIDRLIDRLVMRPAFRPLRGRPGADVAALTKVIPKLARLFAAMPERIAVLEFNPIILGMPGEGAFVADWRIETSGEVK
jgi:acetyltransferase